MMTYTTEAQDISEDSRWRLHFVQFGLLLTALVAAHWQIIANMVDIWYNTTTYNHCFIVAPVSAWLVWRRRSELATAIPENAYSAFALLVLCAVITLTGEISGVNSLRHMGFVGSLMCLVPICFGWPITRRFIFPVLFLGFMVPLGDFLIAPLQELTATVSVWMIEMTGIPVTREGLYIELSSGIWEVAEACAGVRFLIANFFVAALFAYFSYDKLSKWVIFGVLAFAIPVGANCVRAYGIMMLAHATDNALAVGVDHLVYGWFFFSLVMLLMLWVGSRFADRPLTDPVNKAPILSGASRRGGLGVAVSGALLISGCPAFAALTEPEPTAQPSALIAPMIPAGWEVVQWDGNAPDRWIPRFETADRAEMERLSNGEVTVDFVVAYYTHQRDGAEALHYTNRFDDDYIWMRSQLGTSDVETGETGLPKAARLDSLTYVNHANAARDNRFESRMVASWYWVGGVLTADPLEAKLAAMKARLLGGEAGAAVVAISARHDTPGGEIQARRAIEALLADLSSVASALEAVGEN